MSGEFKFKQSSLLQLFLEASKEGVINQNEKLRLKEMLMTQDEKMMNFMNNYNPDESKPVNFKNLKNFLDSCENSIFQMSSPEDNALIRMKKKREIQQAQHNKVETEPDDLEEEEDQDYGFKNSVQMCEEGLSPKITFGKRRNYDDDN